MATSRSPSILLLLLFVSMLGRVSSFAFHHTKHLAARSTSATASSVAFAPLSSSHSTPRRQRDALLTRMSSTRKAGVASPEELREFVEKAGDRLVVIDTRNPDASKEPGDQKSLAVADLPSKDGRPKAQHLIWDRTTASMPLPTDVTKDQPIITHCGGGGRGQLAKDFLEANGYTNVLNGGGPKETDCWAEFGDK